RGKESFGGVLLGRSETSSRPRDLRYSCLWKPRFKQYLKKTLTSGTKRKDDCGLAERGLGAVAAAKRHGAPRATGPTGGRATSRRDDRGARIAVAWIGGEAGRVVAAARGSRARGQCRF